jgi:hypothetical protein
MVSFATPEYPKNSELLFGADGLSAPDEFYQMVPEGGFRNFRVAATRDPSRSKPDIETFLRDEVNRRGGSQNRLNVVATWDLEYTAEKAKVFPIAGSTNMNRPPTNVSFVEVSTPAEGNICGWAHEMGHQLGLGHQLQEGFLMSIKVGDSWRLRAKSIT